MEQRSGETGQVREGVLRGLTFVEDAIYCGLGVLLSTYAITLLVREFIFMAHMVAGHEQGSHPFVQLLDQTLLVLLIVELLYTVQVSFRDHELVVEPFLVIGLISVIRRILVLTAQFPELAQAKEDGFRHAAAEMVLLTLMVVVMVGSLILMQRQAKPSKKSSSAALPPN